jgi:hypothetical protein
MAGGKNRSKVARGSHVADAKGAITRRWLDFCVPVAENLSILSREAGA